MTLQGVVWRRRGPSPISAGQREDNGLVTAIAINPNAPSVIYQGTAGGGTWRSIDGGATWIPQFDRQAALGIGEPAGLAIDPNNTDTLYIGTSQRVTPQLQAGLFKSTDGGNSCIRLGSGYPAGNVGNSSQFVNQWVNVIIVDPADSQRCTSPRPVESSGPPTAGSTGRKGPESPATCGRWCSTVPRRLPTGCCTPVRAASECSPPPTAVRTGIRSSARQPLPSPRRSEVAASARSSSTPRRRPHRPIRPACRCCMRRWPVPEVHLTRSASSSAPTAARPGRNRAPPVCRAEPKAATASTSPLTRSRPATA